MSIQSKVGNLAHTAGDTVDQLVSSVSSRISNIVGTATTGFSNLYSGGFVGMSKEGMETLNTAVEDYCKKIETAISEFEATVERDDAYKGEINDAVLNFSQAMKELLKAYVSTMRKEQEDAALAYNEFHKSESSIAQDVTSDAETVTSDAESIRQEAKKISLE